MNRSPRILLGVSGGIAAYKSAEIVRGLVREGDVRDLSGRRPGAIRPDLGVDLVPRQDRESQRRDELARAARHRDADFGAGADQSAHDLGGFIGGDPPADSEQESHGEPTPCTRT